MMGDIGDNSANHRSSSDSFAGGAISNAQFYLGPAQNCSAEEVQNWFDSFLIAGDIHFLDALLDLCQNVSGSQATALVRSISVAVARLPHPTRRTVVTPVTYGKAVELAIRGLQAIPDDKERINAASSIIDTSSSLRFVVDVMRRFNSAKVHVRSKGAANKELTEQLTTRITKHISELVLPFYICEPDDAASYIHFLSRSGNLDTVRRYLEAALAAYPESAYEFLNAMCSNIALKIPSEEPTIVPLHVRQYHWLSTVVDTARVAEGLSARLKSPSMNRSSEGLDLDWEEKVAMKFIAFRGAESAESRWPGHQDRSDS